MLWHERKLLDYVIFKLEEELHLLTTGNTRDLNQVTDELETALNELPLAELARDVALSTSARDWGIPVQATLRELADRAPAEPWGEIFTAHLSLHDSADQQNTRPARSQ